MSIIDQAVCLRRSDYSETSLVLRMMTRGHGQVALIAKGVKRPKSRLGGAIDLLSVGEAVFVLPRAHSASTLGTLTAWNQTGYYPRLRTDLLRHATATTAGELLGRLTEELDPHPAGFDAMVRLLEQLQAGEPPLRRLADFARVLLADVGLTPNMERCGNCGAAVGAWAAAGIGTYGSAGPGDRPARSGCEQSAAGAGGPGRPRARQGSREVLFSGPRAGLLCPSCHPAPGESHTRISRRLQEFFITGQPLDGKLALEFTRWLVYHVQSQIGRELNSAPALDRAIQAALAALAASGARGGS